LAIYICILTHLFDSVFGDASAMSPGGVRIGTPALTSRGLVESDFEVIAGFLDYAVKLCLRIQQSVGSKSLVAFKNGVKAESKALEFFHEDVKKFARSFPMKGFEVGHL
jgi:glycine hydroxymethyltransferase